MKFVTLLLCLFGMTFMVAACTAPTTDETSETPTTSDSMMDDDAMMDEDGDEMMGDEDDMMMDEDGDEMMDHDSMMDGSAEGSAGGEMLSDVDSDVVSFDVTGENFAFSAAEITVKKGATVTINFESTDGFHDWVVDEFDARTAKVQTGGTTSVTFVADEAGEYEYYCSVGQHRANGMFGKLIVVE